MQIGNFHNLQLVRFTSVGAFLTDGETEVLLPKKFVTNQMEVNQNIRVFVYLDHEERIVATTQHPYVTCNDFAYLKVSHTNQYGAFLQWGLEKDLFVPFREQNTKMEVNKRYLVYVYIDGQSNRLVASSRINKFIDKEPATYTDNEAVEITIYHKTDLGYNVIINKKHKGLLFQHAGVETLRPGDKYPAYIKQVRPDGKLDVTLHLTVADAITDHAKVILEELEANDGFLGLHDNSSPEEIKTVLRMSKKNFKRAVGTLYKNQQIELVENGIRLKN